jgi:hypothetical protein
MKTLKKLIGLVNFCVGITPFGRQNIIEHGFSITSFQRVRTTKNKGKENPTELNKFKVKPYE